MSVKMASVLKTVFVVFCLALLARLPAQAQEVGLTPHVYREIKRGVSAPLREILPLPPENAAPRVIPVLPTEPTPQGSGEPDPAVQTSAGSPLGVTMGLNFEGVGQGVYGFRVSLAPPDTNGSVGDTQFMQWVNASFAVFDKTTGDLLYGPLAGGTLFSDFGAPCDHNGGDGIIVYDKAAGRWLFSQVNAARTVCIALSASSDATDSYYLYAFDLTDLPPQANLSDYPKFGVWPDAYYYTANIFGPSGFLGLNACAFDRSNMLTGDPATVQCFFTNAFGGSYLPSDLDGATPPPDSSPNYLVNLFGNSALRLLKFHVNFEDPSDSSLSGPTLIPVDPFFYPCSGCVPQLGTTQTLEVLGDRLMFRLAYRNFGDHESLVLNHSVNRGDTIVGVRWYEVQSPGDAPFAYQQGTYSPDSDYRWMGSIAMDAAGDIALGYSASSHDIHPAIRFTGRVPSDPLGALEAENTIIDGAGSQLPNLDRWGDYSSLSIDPVDDCTFWYTTEYLQRDGTFNWNTRIASFQFPNCSAPAGSSPH